MESSATVKEWRRSLKAKKAERDRNYRAKNRVTVLAGKRRWYLKNRDRILAQQKERYRQPEQKTKARRATYIGKYNLTVEVFEALFVKQNGRCVICRRTLTMTIGQGNTCHVDHCHKANKVRGLLCGKCNRGIGLLNDDPRLLRHALRYLLTGGI